MHIVLITPGFPADKRDTTCIPPLQAYAKSLRQQLEVSVITLHYPFRKGSYYWNGVEVFACRQKAVKGLYQLLMWRNAWRYFRRIHRRQPVDVIHSFWLNDSALLGHWLGKRWGVPHLTTLMGQDARHRTNPFLRWVRLKSWDTVVLSAFQQKVLKDNTGHEARHLIPWGIDACATRFYPQATERKIDVLGVGALISLKNYRAFIRAVATLQKERAGLRAVLIGEGPERVSLEQSVQALGLDGTITFTGKIERAKVLAYMRNSRVLLHPSTYESQGFVFFEALSAGMNIVSYSIGVAGQSSRWYVAETEEDLTQGVRFMLETPPVHSPVSVPTMEDTVAAYLNIYYNLI
jgi:glycosyltransferase involved in cell wall biosynthesis